MKRIFSILLATLGLVTAFSCMREEPVVEELELDRCLSPIELKASVKEGEYLQFSWKPVSSVADKYIIQVCSDVNYEELVGEYTVDRDQIPYTVHLEADNTYYYRIKAIDTKTGVADSKWVEGEEPLQTIAIKNAIEISLVDRTATTVTIKWANDPEVTDIVVTPGIAEGEDQTRVPLTVDQIAAATATIEGLAPSTRYNFNVYYKSADRGGIAVWTRPEVEGEMVAVVDTAHFHQALKEGATSFKFAYADTVYVLGKVEAKGDFKIVGESTVDGKKPVLKVDFHSTADLSSFHAEDVALTGETNVAFTVETVATFTDVEFINVNFDGYKAGLYYDNKGAAITGHLLFDSVLMENIEGAGGDCIDIRQAGSQIAELTITNSTFNGGTRTFLRLDANPTVNKIVVSKNTFNNMCTSSVNKIEGSNVNGILHVRAKGDSFDVRNNLFLNCNCWLVSNNSASRIPTFAKNYTFNCVDAFYTSAKGTSTKAGMNKAVVLADKGVELTDDPCIDSEGGNFYVTVGALVTNSIGDPRWHEGAPEELPEDLTMVPVEPVKTWDFTDGKFFRKQADKDMVRDGIRFYVHEKPVLFDNANGALVLQSASTVHDCTPVDGAFAFAINKPGTVVVSTKAVTSKAATLVVCLDGEPVSAVVAGAEAHTVVFPDIVEGENHIVGFHSSDAISVTFLQFNDEVEQGGGDTVLATPVVTTDKNAVNVGADEKITFTWEAVAKAGSYEVFDVKANKTVTKVTENKYELSTKSMKAGWYQYAFIAHPAETDKVRESSDTSEVVKFTIKEVQTKLSASKATVWGKDFMLAGIAEFGEGTELTENMVYNNLGFLAGGSKFKFGTDNADTDPKPRVQLGGTGTVNTKCNLQLLVSGPGSLSIKGRSAGDAARYLMLAVGTQVINADGYEMPDKTQDPAVVTVDVESAEGDIVNIYSKSGGINLYEIEWTPKDGGTGSATKGDAGFVKFDDYVGKNPTEIESGSLKLTATLGEGQDPAKKLIVDANSCYFGTAESQITLTSRLKTGGASSSSNNITLTLASGAEGKLKVYARTGSNSATDRYIKISKGTDALLEHVLLESEAINHDFGGETGVKAVYPVYEIDVEAGTYSVEYNSGINIYGVEFVPNAGTSDSKSEVTYTLAIPAAVNAEEKYVCPDKETFYLQATGGFAIDANARSFAVAGSTEAAAIVPFANRFKGSATSSTKTIKIVVPSDGTLYIAARSGNGTATDRTISLVQGGQTILEPTVCKDADAFKIGETTCSPFVVSEVSAGEIEVVLNSGINIYGIVYVTLE